jgi:glycosyltransferase involved in cell wall biosynthesis
MLKARLSTRYPKIAHIITDMNGYGGTEITLLRYILRSKIPCEHHRVIVLRSIGVDNTLGAQMVAAGIQVLALHQKRGSFALNAMVRLYRELANFEPDVISGWLYHPSLLASVLAPVLKGRPMVVWHIRNATFSSLLKTPSRFIAQRALALLSCWANPILVSNSSVAVNEHATIGFDARPERWTIIHNGIDAAQYAPKHEEGRIVRHELGIPYDALLVGCVGRFVPEKGYAVMFKALAIVLERLRSDIADRLHFVAMGEGVSHDNDDFMRLAVNGIPFERLHLLGKRADVQRILKAFDVYALPSISEAFPNSLVEAMATGLPCVATRVGECCVVLPSTDFIVQPHDVLQLADRLVALLEMSHEERSVLGRDNRQRAINRFGIEQMVDNFDALFERAATGGQVDMPEIIK